MKKSKSIILFIACCLLACPQIASAAAKAVVSLKTETVKEGDNQVNVSCEISSSEKMTNGKFRITYDSAQLKLKSAKQGQALSGTSAEINDPVEGTKEEGEIVFVFANAAEMDANGSLLDMEFDLDDSVKDGDQISIDVKAEQLVCDSVNLEAEAVPLTITVGASQSGSQTDTESESETKKQNNQSDSNTNQTGNTGGSGSSGNGSTSGNNNTSGNNQGTSTTSQVKTGDTTNILIPVLLMGAAAVVFALTIYRKKAKSK